MKTYEERTKDILSKVAAAKRRRRAITSVVSLCCCMVLITGLMLIPWGGSPGVTDSAKIRRSEGYGPLIQELSILLESGSGVSKGDDLMDGDLTMGVPESAPSVDAMPDSDEAVNGTYEEITDNQVQGVTEADLIKRSDRHIYYLRGTLLTVYSIEGADSKELGSYEIGSELGDGYRVYTSDAEMYLSQDCGTVTVMAECYHKPEGQRYLYALSLDVTDPEDIEISGSCFLKGSYTTSRLVDEELYIVSALYVSTDADLEDESTFLPGYGTPEDMTYLPMEDICIPEEPSAAMYTVVTKLDSSSLTVEDSLALLSYTGQVYMSRENIYLTRSYYETNEVLESFTSNAITEITRVAYGDMGLEEKGSFCVDGTVEDQYYMDEHDGILRVVTSIDHTTGVVRTMEEYDISYHETRSRITNASLYCIDLTDHSIRAKVEQFAPEGESVRSVRFDGDAAYVCTSIVLQDPVFFFDLSDLDDIRCKDTGTIDGYSMSLVDFAEGFLMGIGYGDSFDTLKIEMYREGATTVESHCVYEYELCWFSGDYKSYYIDREEQLIGLGVHPYDEKDCRYILLHFDGYELVELLDVELPGDPETIRAVYIDGYLYLFGEGFRVERVG